MKRTIISILLLMLTCAGLFSQTGTLNICDNTNDEVYPINVYTTVSVNTPVRFQIQFDEPLYGNTERSQMFILWEVFSISDNGDETPVGDLHLRTESGYRRYATEEQFYFKQPGKYAVYAIDYYKRDVLEKRGYKEYFGKTFIDITN